MQVDIANYRAFVIDLEKRVRTLEALGEHLSGSRKLVIEQFNNDLKAIHQQIDQLIENDRRQDIDRARSYPPNSR